MSRDDTSPSAATEPARSPAKLTTAGRDPHEVLRAAAAFADADELAELEALDRRWAERRLQVLVAGEAKRGKSSLINALLGRPVLPTGITPLTSVTTTVSSVGETGTEHLNVTFADGRRTQAPLSKLAAFVTEAENPSNMLDVRGVTVFLHSPLLTTYAVDLVDTPGIGSIYAHNTTEAHDALARLDAAVLVLSVDPPISAAERDLLHAILASSVRTFVVVNKCDRYTPEEVSQSLAFTRTVCREAAGEDLDPRPCSVLRGEDDPGFATFRGDMLDYLAKRGDEDLRIALRRHTARLLTAMRDRRRLERRAIELADHGEADKVAALRARLAAISGQRSEIKDRITGSLRRLHHDLDAAAAAAVPALARQCQAAFEQYWAESLVHAPLADVDMLAHTVIADHLTKTVDTWRQEQTSHLQGELTLVVNRAHSETEAQIALARHAVSDALDIQFATHEAEVALPMDTRFHYDFAPALSWAPPLEGVASRLRTPAARRRSLKSAAYDSIRPLTDRQVGRARSDLQARLDAAGRAVADSLEQRLDATVDGMVRVLDRVTGDHGLKLDREGRLRDLTTAEAALSTLQEESQRL